MSPRQQRGDALFVSWSRPCACTSTSVRTPKLSREALVQRLDDAGSGLMALGAQRMLQLPSRTRAPGHESRQRQVPVAPAPADTSSRFFMIAERWFLTVRRLTPSSVAMFLLG